MSGAPAPTFPFDRSWVFPVPPAELWQAISRTDRFPEWWAWLRSFDSDGLAVGSTARCVVRAPLPYTLSFRVAIHRVVPERLLDTFVSGDLEGPARLEVEPHPKGSTARLVWDLQLRPPVLRAASRLARPLMVWGHDWVVDNGVRQFVTVALREGRR